MGANRVIQQLSASEKTWNIDSTPRSKCETTPAGNFLQTAAHAYKGSSHDGHCSASAAKAAEFSELEDNHGLLQCKEAEACVGLREHDASPGTEATAVPVEHEQEVQEGILEDNSSDDGGCTAAPSEYGDDKPMEWGPLVKVHGNRITWFVVLRGTPPLPSVFESPPFAIGEIEGAHLRLRACASTDNGAPGCILSVHFPSARPSGLQVGLFAGKGWRKAALTQWSDDSDIEKRFSTDLVQRSSLLCGLVFRMMPGH